MSATGSSRLDEVLARIDAEPMADADALAQMPLAELERQLAELGVDVDKQLAELLDQVGSAKVGPPDEQWVADLDSLSVQQVEHRLEGEGVDVGEWLARAGQLIGSAHHRADSMAVDASATVDPGRTPVAVPRPVSQRRPARAGARRRVPQALAASIAIVALGGVTFSLLHKYALDVAPLRVGESDVVAADAPHAATHPAAPVATRSILGVTGEWRDARLPVASDPASSGVVERTEELERSEAALSDKASSAPLPKRNRDKDSAAPRAVGDVVEFAAPGQRPEPAAPDAGRVRKEAKKPARLNAPKAVLRSRAAKANAVESQAAGEQTSIVHELMPGTSLADSLAALTLQAEDERALLELFAGSELAAGARLRLSMLEGFVQSASLLVHTGLEIGVVRNTRGVLVRK